MKKRIIILLAIILSLALFAGCAKQPTGSGDKGTEPGDGKRSPLSEFRCSIVPMNSTLTSRT